MPYLGAASLLQLCDSSLEVARRLSHSLYPDFMSFTYKYLLNDNIVEKGEANLPPSTLVYLAEQAVALNKKIFF